MRYLLTVDIDDSRQVDYALVDFRSKEMTKLVRKRIKTFLDLRKVDGKALELIFDENENNCVKFYSGMQKMGSNGLTVISPLVLEKTKKLAGVPEFFGIYEIAGDAEAGTGFNVIDIEMHVGEEGLYFRAYLFKAAKELVTVAIPLEILAKKFNLPTS